MRRPAAAGKRYTRLDERSARSHQLALSLTFRLTFIHAMNRTAICLLLLALVAGVPAASGNSITESLGDVWESVSGALRDAFSTVVATVKDAAE